MPSPSTFTVMLHRHLATLTTVLILPSLSSAALDSADTYKPLNTQPPGSEPPSAQDVTKGWKLPPGFKATLFAGEPDVRQPIDMKFDDRGRLWVAEAYSYQEWKRKGEDRIIILEDTDHDGMADKRTIFKTGFNHLSSVEIGFGGVWVLDSPNLVFIPDANGDDVPDGEAKVILDGWTIKGGHNMVSGLTWGPDGWLYGRHGITTPSMVGKPGTPEAARTFVEPGIWRVDPVNSKFECIVKGTTNPWGLDWDENGEMFMSGNVNGHLWHVIPGSLFERMFGSGSVPYDFERLKMIGERMHFDTSGDWKSDWSKADKGRASENNLGGGHSHCGLMIYQADNWPAQYRGHFFMNNTHGRRINEESVEPNSATYLSKHVGDLAVANTTWFRGVSVLSGPDGGVYVTDWCDDGECHDQDGVHRTSGRIYKITYGDVKAPELRGGLQKWSQRELTDTIANPNVWYFQHANRLLKEQSLAGKAFSEVKRANELAATEPQKLRALWLLNGCNSLGERELIKYLGNANSHLRLWAARLLTDAGKGAAEIQQLAGQEPDLLVLAHLAGISNRLPEESAWKLMETLAKRKESAAPVLELLVWYALEPLTGKAPKRAASLLPAVASAKVRNFIVRRLAATIDQAESREAIGALLEMPTADIMNAIAEGVAGRTKLPQPGNWASVRAKLLAKFPSQGVALGMAFGDPGIIVLLNEKLNNAAVSVEERRAALQALSLAKPENLTSLVEQSFAKPELRLAAINAASGVASEKIPDMILSAWDQLSKEERAVAIDVLASRKNWSVKLLTEVGAGKVRREEISLGQARQLSLIKDEKVTSLLAANWGKVGSSSEEKKAEILKFRELLTKGSKGDETRGKTVFNKVCSVCHTLFGEGGKLGPDLTGSGRKDLDYILLNVLDPNASVPRDYQMTVVTLKDGQVLAGTIPSESDQTITLQSITERKVLEKSACAKIERQSLSWMPEGLLQQLSEKDLRDLVSYLAK